MRKDSFYTCHSKWIVVTRSTGIVTLDFFLQFFPKKAFKLAFVKLWQQFVTSNSQMMSLCSKWFNLTFTFLNALAFLKCYMDWHLYKLSIFNYGETFSLYGSYMTAWLGWSLRESCRRYIPYLPAKNKKQQHWRDFNLLCFFTSDGTV